jgi:hypothetical protein
MSLARKKRKKERRRSVGKIADEIKKIQVEETLTLPELFQKYPHLANLQYKELQEEDNLVEEQSKKKKLLLD